MRRVGHRKPLYSVVQDEILNLISQWDHREPIPSEMDLSKQMGVSRATVREAIHRLENSDILYKRRGVGTFIRKRKGVVSTALNNLHGIQNIVRSMGKKPSFKEQRIELVTPPEKIIAALGVSRLNQLLRVSQVYLADDVSIIKGVSFLSPAMYEDDVEGFMETIRLEGEKGYSLFQIIDKQSSFSVEYAVARIEAAAPDEELVKALELSEQRPVVCLEETHYSADGTPLIYSIDYIDAKRFELYVVRRRSY
jgi:GntR family transcriptional regulator